MHDALPRAVVFPRDTADVAAIVRACADARVPFVARGAGTGLSGGATALDGGIVLALNRMDRVLAVDPVDRTATLEPGVRNLAVSEAAAEHGLFYAPDPSSQAVCTVGGNVAHNSGGPHTLKHGVTVNHVLGLTLVQPDGHVVRVGDGACGYDLLALLTGSEGTLGIVTEVTVRLLRRPETVVTLLAAFDSIEAASEATSAVIAAGIVPAALEMLDAEVVTALRAAFGFEFPGGAQALLLVECDGVLPGMDEELADVSTLLREHGALSLRAAHDDAERAEIWTARKKAFGALGRIARHYYTQDGVIPRTRLPEMLRRVREVAARRGLRVANVFHAGDGNLHPCILFDSDDDKTKRNVLEAGAEILRHCVELGGSLTGEHGVGVEKREWMSTLYAPDDLAVMARLRDALDPSGLCNPKKVLPLGAGCGELSALGRRAAL
ncbi:MAG: FAD-binding protein [Planctomycetes bacterium]|nr:FAD-binding protein [Planctomycetota bacterium]